MTTSNRSKEVSGSLDKKKSCCTCVTVNNSGFLISDDTEVLIESAKTAASASNATVSNVTERLRNISQEVERITLTKDSVNVDLMLIDADQACEYLRVEISQILKLFFLFFRLFKFIEFRLAARL